MSEKKLKTKVNCIHKIQKYNTNYWSYIHLVYYFMGNNNIDNQNK